MGERKELKIQCYCMNLRHISNMLTKYYDQALALVHITANQFFLLYVIHFLETCNKSELARYTRLERTTVIRDLDILLKKDLVRQIPGPTKRNLLICLTEEGEKTRERGEQIWEDVQKSVSRLLGEEHLAAMEEMLKRMEALEEKI